MLFELWAPAARRVRLRANGTDHDLDLADGGWWRTDVPDVVDYAYVLDDTDVGLPDPRSRWQPTGVHGPSRVYDQNAYEWADSGWTGCPLPGGVVYEMHVGTFTPAGTFDAAIGKLDHLVELGIDFVEVLPVNAFNGQWNWGYDGVDWYAVHDPYGGPDGLKRFVDACHGRGLAVLLDVVYNHLGPSGNYLDRFGPYFSAASNTWGAALNLDGPDSDPVRRHIVDNALMWLSDYHVDGLRLDAVHALVDHRAIHLLEQMAVEVDSLSTHLGRPLSLIGESDLNDPRLITPREAGGYGLAAQWSDDFHHALHTVLTGERQGYYGDFGSLQTLATTLRQAFFHAGTWSTFRRRAHGRPVDVLQTPGWRFLGYLQDHDQIGNRATGDRITATVSTGLAKVGAMFVLTAPFTPMLFMGEEWAASTPWQFFTSHPEPELAATVARGRAAEFAEHGWAGTVRSDPASGADSEVPDPQDPQTFENSKLRWAELTEQPHSEMLAFYRRLIAVRRERPELTDPRLSAVSVDFDEEQQWLVMRRGDIAVVGNFAVEERSIPVGGWVGPILLSSVSGHILSHGEHVDVPAESAVVMLTRAM